MKKSTYFAVYEYFPDELREKRCIWTFDNENAAHDLVEFLLRSDFMNPKIGVEEYEAST